MKSADRVNLEASAVAPDLAPTADQVEAARLLLKVSQIGAQAGVWIGHDGSSRLADFTKFYVAATSGAGPKNERTIPEWLVEMCMVTEAVTPTADIKATVQKLIDWHCAVDRAAPQQEPVAWRSYYLSHPETTQVLHREKPTWLNPGMYACEPLYALPGAAGATAPAPGWLREDVMAVYNGCGFSDRLSAWLKQKAEGVTRAAGAERSGSQPEVAVETIARLKLALAGFHKNPDECLGDGTGACVSHMAYEEIVATIKAAGWMWNDEAEKWEPGADSGGSQQGSDK
jgi:hypothetical protein